ncbi:MAG: protein-glutamate O-methyltransferase CheR [Pseudomonadota bacterium]
MTDHAGILTLSESQFNQVARMVRSEAGLVLDTAKRPMVQSRLLKRLRTLELSSFDAYLDVLGKDADGAERLELICALTTNVTNFFRENHHFEQLKAEILPKLKQAAGSKKIRIWSAGCSFGHEPYSVAMACLPFVAAHPDVDLRILATDIDRHAIAVARAGIYTENALTGVPPTARTEHFSSLADGRLKIGETLRRMVSFQPLNLLDAWPMKGRFDVIFCRNVVIYFDPDTQNQLWRRFHEALTPEGWLFVGHSERIPDRGMEIFEPAGVTSYRKPVPPERQPRAV